MRESLPKKKRGDRLSAKHVNQLNSISRRTAVGATGSYLTGVQYSVAAVSSLPPFQQELVKIVSEESTGLYNIKRRYFDHASELWQDDNTSNQLLLDAGSVNATYSVDDIVVAFWHPQRMAFVPTTIASQAVLKIGKAQGEIAVDATDGVVAIWEHDTLLGNQATGDVLSDVHHDWITNDLAIEDGKEVILGWFPSESCWRVIGAECP